MRKKLVAYFSASGRTKKVAEMIAESAKGDLFEITPKTPYTKADLNWRIILGFPIWWYVASTIINTFLETYNFSHKKIILFATSGGSGFGSTVQELQRSASGALITEGKIIFMEEGCG